MVKKHVHPLISLASQRNTNQNIKDLLIFMCFYLGLNLSLLISKTSTTVEKQNEDWIKSAASAKARGGKRRPGTVECPC